MDHKALDVIGVEESSGDVFSEVAGSKTSSSSSSQDKKSEMKGSEIKTILITKKTRFSVPER